VQHVLLIMVAPPLLVYGRPVTLLLHAVHNPWHSRVKRLLRSACSRALTWPAAATALYAVVVAGTHTPPVMGLVLRDGAAHDGEHLLYLAAGYLFFLPVVGSEPVPWRLGTLGRYLMLVAGMQVDSAVGVLLWVQQHEVFPAYARTARPAGLSPLADLHVGGMVMWAGSDVVMALLAIALALALVAPRRPGRTGEASAATLAAHNSYVQSLSLGQATPSGEP
jgi:putative copper resistance protein D